MLFYLTIYSSEARLKAERSSELGWQKKKWTKKRYQRRRTTRRQLDHRFCTCSNYSLSCRSFCLSLPLPTSKNFFWCFPLPQSIEKTFSENNFCKNLFWKKKKTKKMIHFFFRFVFFSNFFFFRFYFFFRFFFFVQNLLNTLSFSFFGIHLPL